MNLRLQQELLDLRSRFGSLDRLTADELAELVDCCRRADSPFGEKSKALIDAPAARLRGFEFRPLTVGASIWLDEYAAKWWGDNDNRYFWALVYALVHGHERAAFLYLTSENAARRAICRMSLQFAFSRRALEEAVDKALGRAGNDGRDDEGPDATAQAAAMTDWTAVVARLEAESGIGRDEWLWGRSAEYTVRAYYELHSFAARCSGAAEKRRMFDELDRAINALARLKKRIKERLENEQGR